jgi:hypothetical protein
MRAAESGQPDVIKLLLREGARKEATNREGLNASSRARREGHSDIADLFSSTD